MNTILHHTLHVHVQRYLVEREKRTRKTVAECENEHGTTLQTEQIIQQNSGQCGPGETYASNFVRAPRHP